MITPEQQQQWAQYKQTSGFTPPSGTTGGNTYDAIDKLIASGGPSTSEPSLGARVGTDISQAGQQVRAAIKGQGQYAGDAPLTRGFEAASAAAGAIPQVASELLPRPAREAVGAVSKAGSDVINWLGNVIGSTQAAQDFVKNHPQAADSLAQAAKVGQSAGNIAGTALLAEGSAAGAGKVAGVVPKVAKTVATKAGEIADKAPLVETPTVVSKIADEWKAPTVPKNTTNPASFKNARMIVQKNPDVPQFLAEQKLHPATMIENGRYATGDTAQMMRETPGQLSKDLLRPSLQEASAGTPKTPVSEIIANAKKSVSSDPSITEGTRAQISARLDREAKLLQKKYPNGMDLVQMHDNKITYSLNGGYSPIKSAADNAVATANRNLGRALGKAVEEKAPSNLPVSEFNKYLQKYYNAADYLDSINTKKAPRSVGQYIAYRGSQVAGAVAGHGVGGGILGGVGGYMIGGALERAVANMTGPMRAMVLRKLETTNPAVFKQVSDYLGAEQTARSMRLALPAPKELGTPENPRPMQGRTAPSSAPKILTPGKTFGKEPKTGKYMRVYKSTGKTSQ